jgi:flagellar basal body P-ring formation protein FlgA
VRGKALEDGAEGDVIKITNIQSERSIEAHVVGTGRVAVNAVLPVTAQLAVDATDANPKIEQ